MSAIAKILLEMGYKVSGSDLCQTDMTLRLSQAGAVIFAGHAAENIAAADAVVISTAIPENNPELKAARELGITVFHRADLVAAGHESAGRYCCCRCAREDDNNLNGCFNAGKSGH